MESDSKFQVGDRVRCVNPLEGSLGSGETYVVLAVDHDEEDDIALLVNDDTGRNRWFWAERFVPLPRKPDDWNASPADVADEDILAVASTNPKDRIGTTKPPFHLAPASAVLLMNQAMKDGGEKYGPYNWRETNVRAEVYFNAAMRHLNQWFHGETHARDSGVHHLGHAMACLAILIDAEIEGSLIDNRPKHKVPFDDLIERFTDL